MPLDRSVEKRAADLRTVLLTTLDDSLDMVTMSTHGDRAPKKTTTTKFQLDE